jgi:hypothetical protein
MEPFEALYGRRYRTLLNWIEPVEKLLGRAQSSVAHRVHATCQLFSIVMPTRAIKSPAGSVRST